jgi:Ca2+-binding RTX toxin-like protein
MATITGTTGNDILAGTTSADQIYGLEGNDTLSGGGGNDVLDGGAGADALDGGSGTDTATYANSAAAVNVSLATYTGSGGDAEGDTLSSIEVVIGSNFNDTLTCLSAGATLQGGAGDDLYVVGNQSVVVTEAAGGGADEVQTALTVLSIASYANVEKLTYTGTLGFTGAGNAGDNVITGGSGNDNLSGGAGADQFFGNGGTDTVNYADATAGVSINLKTGIHTGIAAGDTYNSIEVIQGSSYNDTFVGDASANTFNGMNGIDTIDYSTSSAAINVNLTTGTGSGGDAQGDTLSYIDKVIATDFNDTLSSSSAGTTLQGGAGDDLYVVGNQSVVVTEAAGGGTDEVQTALISLNIASYANVEKLTYTGTVNFVGTGNANDNIIIGGVGNDTFVGGAGADEFHGGAGTDTVTYIDSYAGITFNFATGSISGIGNGDTFYDIEKFIGSNYGDIFIENGDIHDFNGGNGVDMVSYETATSGITFDLSTLTKTGIAAGDTPENIEVIQATGFADTLVGDSNANIFIGGAGSDTIDGGTGSDSAWYLTSSAAVQIDLLAGTTAGGDAAGDTLTSIENLIGSAYGDTLTGDTLANKLEGGDGNDTINGGDGADTIFGGIGSDVGSVAVSSGAVQVDTLYGGNGNDSITTAANDTGSAAFGEAGNDMITVANGTADGGVGNDQITVTAGGTAYGGEGDDVLYGNGSLYFLYGDAGNDVLNLNATGEAYGGEGSDIYNIYTTALVAVKDTGAAGVNDYVYLRNIATLSDVLGVRTGDDLFITSNADMNDNGHIDSGVYLQGWYAGGNTIESFVTANNTYFQYAG